MLQLLRYAFAYTFGVLGFLVVVVGPQLLPRILTKDWMGSVENELSSTSWILIVLFALAIFKKCVLPYSSSMSFIELLSQSYRFRSIRILFSQFPFWNSCLNAWCALIFNLVACRPPWYTCFKRLRILNLIGFAVHDSTLLSRSPETCGWEGCSCLLLKVRIISSLQPFLNFDNSNAT